MESPNVWSLRQVFHHGFCWPNHLHMVSFNSFPIISQISPVYTCLHNCFSLASLHFKNFEVDFPYQVVPHSWLSGYVYKSNSSIGLMNGVHIKVALSPPALPGVWSICPLKSCDHGSWWILPGAWVVRETQNPYVITNHEPFLRQKYLDR